MSWLEQNKFLAGLIGVTAVGALGLGYVIVSNGSELDDLKVTLADKIGELQRVEGAKAFPNLENKTAIEANTKEYGETLNELQDKLVAYAPDTNSSVTVAEFQGLQNAYVDKLRVMFEGVKTPENCRFGFDEYASKMVPQRATRTLSYQLEALEAMFSELADISPKEVINVYRPLSALEVGEEAGSQGGAARSRRAGKSKAAYSSLSVELGLKMEEPKLMEFLERLANHKEYYFVVRLLRIKNERETSPNASELSFSKKGGSATVGGGGGGFFFDSDVEESSSDSEEPAVSTTRVLQQILGNEALDAHLKIDVIMFHSKEESVLPTLN